jgi:hypothetical protein
VVDVKKEACQKDSRIRGTKERSTERDSRIRRLLQKEGLQDQADKKIE